MVNVQKLYSFVFPVFSNVCGTLIAFEIICAETTRIVGIGPYGRYSVMDFDSYCPFIFLGEFIKCRCFL